jgi:FkbM family methyltransferase
MNGIYSQNNEDMIALEYFGKEVGRLLEIGANDGKTLSNSLALIEKGWEAVLVEPDPAAYERLCNLHRANDKVQCLQIAIGSRVGKMEFHSSGTLLNADDVSLVSTLIPAELDRWSGIAFRPIEVNVTDWKNFELGELRYDFISIDAEGMDLEIARQIDLRAAGCKMLCIEWNSKDKQLYDEVIIRQGYELYAANAENLIYVRSAGC